MLQNCYNFAEAMRETRINHRMTQRYMETLTLIPYQRLSEYERDIRLPAKKNLNKILKAFEINGADKTELTKLQEAYKQSLFEAPANRLGKCIPNEIPKIGQKTK